MDHSTMLLVPLLVLGVVMAFAFAGCGAFGTEPTPPEKKDDHPQNGTTTPHNKGTTHPPVVVVPPADPTPTDAYPKLILREKDNSTDPESTKSLRSYWRLAEAIAAEDAADSDDRQPQPGKYNGAVDLHIAGVLRQGSDPKDFCAEFNGTDAFVEVPNSPLVNPPGAFTLEAWVRLTSDLAADVKAPIISSFQPQGNSGFTLSLVGASTTLAKAQIQLGGGTLSTLEADVHLDAETARDKWHHIVATFGKDAGTDKLQLYVDGAAPTVLASGGAQVLTYTPARDIFPGDAPFRIGAGPGARPTSFFKGQIDEVALYGAALAGGIIGKHFTQATTK